MSRRQRAVAAALVIVLLGAVAIVFAAVGHKAKHASGGPVNPGPTTSAPPATGAGLGRYASTNTFGISTGVALFNESTADIDNDMAGIAATGAHWVRTAVRWDVIEPDRPTSDDWSKPDRLVADAQQHGLSLIFDLTGTPRWAAAAGANTSEFPTDLQTYATFAGKLATRYKGRVAAYELGNEPNHVKTFKHPDPALYAQVLKLSYPLIKAADPHATVLTGGLGGIRDKKGNFAGDTFLAALYQDGAKNYFDGVSYHPYTYPLLASQDDGSRGWSRMLKARQTMVANGDGAKRIWVTEYGAPTNGGGGSITEEQQSQMVADAYRLWSSYPWAGPLCWFDYRDKGNDTGDKKDFYGLYASDGSPKPSLRQYEELAQSVR